MIRSFCCVLPVSVGNDPAMIRQVIERTLAVTPNLLVVDDASGDSGLESFCCEKGVERVLHESATGIGGIFQTAAALLSRRGVSCMITLDPGSHCFPEDLPRFISYLHKKEPYTITIGCRDFPVPPQNGIAGSWKRKLTSFLFRLETGLKSSDAGSPFCVYPVHFIKRLKMGSQVRDYRMELLVRAVWANVNVRSLRVRFAATQEVQPDRIDFLTHLKLIGLRLLPCKKQTLCSGAKFHFSLLHPKPFFDYLLKENASPGELAAAAFTGTYCAVLPLFGLHTPVVLYFATVFRLNKFLAFMIQHPFVLLPITPFLCIELGFLMRHGEWLTDISLQTVFYEIHYRILEWLLGSLVLAPVFAVLSAVITYFSAAYLQKKIRLNFWAKQRKILTENKTDTKE